MAADSPSPGSALANGRGSIAKAARRAAAKALSRYPERIARSVLLLLLALGFHEVIAAEEYPTRPIDFVVPWGTGGGADYIGRALSKSMSPLLGVSLPVLNMPGATGQTGIMKLKDSTPDGYVIEEVTSETILLLVTGRPRFALGDFICLGIIDQQPAGLLLRPGGPLKTWDDVRRAAKTRTLSVAFDGFGSSGDLIIKYLGKKEGLSFQLVPNEKPGERIASVLGGHNDLLFTQPGDVLSYINSKQLEPIILFADERDSRFKDVPTSREFGYDASLVHFRALYVRNGIDAQRLTRLKSAVDEAVRSSEFQQALAGEYAAANSYVPAARSDEYIGQWLDQARKISAASARK